MKSFFRIRAFIKAWLFGYDSENVFIRYRAVTLTVVIGAVVSLSVFVIFFQRDLRHQHNEFTSSARSEQSFIAKEFSDLEASILDAYSQLGMSEGLNSERIELLFRNELRSRFFRIIFFQPVSGAPPEVEKFGVFSSDDFVVSNIGLPTIEHVDGLEPYIIPLGSSHPLFGLGSFLVAMPFKNVGTLFVSVNIPQLLRRVTDRKVFSSMADIFLYSDQTLIATSSDFKNWSIQGADPTRLDQNVANYTSISDVRSIQFLNQTWTSVLVPSQGFISSGFSFYPWLFFLACLVVTGSVAFAFFQMISTRVEIEATVKVRTRELREKSEELVRLNKELKDFAYIVSHDLQEPIRTISSFLDIFVGEFGNSIPAEGHEMLVRVKAASKRMHRLLKDILRYSRLSVQVNRFHPLDLNILIHEVWDDLQAKVDEERAQLKIEGQLPEVRGDAVQLRQLFLNLFSNAIKFRRKDVAPEIRVLSFAVPGEDRCVIRISDNGVGFDEKYAEMIFKPFHRLHREEEIEGSGIGLSICRKIVESHGGQILAESKPGEGSAFIVYLPSCVPSNSSGSSRDAA